MGVFMAKKLINIQAEEEFIKMAKEYAKSHYMTLTAFIIRSIQEYIVNHKND